MSRPHLIQRTGGVIAALALATAAAGCSDGAATSADTPAPGESRVETGGGLPSPHVHAVAVDPADGVVLLATHDGLFRLDEGEQQRVGPVVDLMGFTVVGPGRYYASGHPGPGTELPQPVGLIESTDTGRTWTSVSRAGESDFHALTASRAGVVAFDGVLRTSTDGRTWTDFEGPGDLFDVAASPDGEVLLSTTPNGPQRSTDGGATWAPVERAPLLLLVEWSGESRAVGITPEGELQSTSDQGLTWAPAGRVEGPPQALGVEPGADASTDRVLVVTADTVWDSLDGGERSHPWRQLQVEAHESQATPNSTMPAPRPISKDAPAAQ